MLTIQRKDAIRILNLVKKYINQSAIMSPGVSVKNVRKAYKRELMAVDLCAKISNKCSNKLYFKEAREAMAVYREWHADKDYMSWYGKYCREHI